MQAAIRLVCKLKKRNQKKKTQVNNWFMFQSIKGIFPFKIN
jgi:hypothetical protein